MLYVFQLGNVRLFNAFGKESQNAGIQSSSENTTGSIKLPWGSKKMPGFAGYTASRGDVTITDTFVNSEHYTQFQRENMYSTLLRLPYVDVIAYRYEDFFDSNFADRNDHARTPQIVWYHTIATVKKVDPKYTDKSIDITLNLLDEWTAINRYTWRFYNTFKNLSVIEALSPVKDNLGAIPREVVLRKTLNGYWTKQLYDDPLLFYDQYFWEEWHNYLPIGYPATGYGTARSEVTQYSFYLDSSLWGGRTYSLYQWSGLSPTGSIDMYISHQDGIFGTTNYLNTINLELLNTKMAEAGFTGLLPSDTLMIDEYLGKKSFIIREGAIIDSVYPVWTYQGMQLGQTGRGRNTIKLYYTHPTGYTFTFGQLHHFRVL